MGKPESPVGMVEIAGRSGQKHRGFLEAGLLLLLLLVTGALVTLGLLYADSRGEWGQQKPPPSKPKAVTFGFVQSLPCTSRPPAAEQG